MLFNLQVFPSCLHQPWYVSHVSCKYLYPSRLSCWQTLIPLQRFQQNVFLCWKSLLARILLMKNGSQWWVYLWNREEKQILLQLLRHTKSEVDPQSHVIPWAKLFHWIWYAHTYPTCSKSATSFISCAWRSCKRRQFVRKNCTDWACFQK